MALKNTIGVVSLCLSIIPTCSFSKDILVFAIDLVRYGDRTPTHQLPKAPIYSKDSLGHLTHKGIKQHVRLGKQLRKEYVKKHRLLHQI